MTWPNLFSFTARVDIVLILLLVHSLMQGGDTEVGPIPVAIEFRDVYTCCIVIGFCKWTHIASQIATLAIAFAILRPLPLATFTTLDHPIRFRDVTCIFRVNLPVEYISLFSQNHCWTWKRSRG